MCRMHPRARGRFSIVMVIIMIVVMLFRCRRSWYVIVHVVGGGGGVDVDWSALGLEQTVGGRGWTKKEEPSVFDFLAHATCRWRFSEGRR